MTITKEQLEQLTRIYNGLKSVNTKGEDTLMMADCLRALEQLIVLINNQSQQASAPTPQTTKKD